VIFRQNDNVSIELEGDSPPYRVHGTFIEEDENWVKVEGTVGDTLGKMVVVPKERIKVIVKG
jgi:hypothetical protein